MDANQIFDAALQLPPNKELLVEALDEGNKQSLRTLLFRQRRRCLDNPDIFPEIKDIAREIYVRDTKTEDGKVGLRVGRRPDNNVVVVDKED